MMLEKRIMDHEGFRKKIYADSLGKKTIGFGHLITENDNFEEGIEYTNFWIFFTRIWRKHEKVPTNLLVT